MGITEKIDNIVETIKKRVELNSDRPSLEKIISNKKKYFDSKDHIWDSELLFRIWRFTFLRMMKEDGFIDEVRHFNNLIRNKNNYNNSVKENELTQRIDTIPDFIENSEFKYWNQSDFNRYEYICYGDYKNFTAYKKIYSLIKKFMIHDNHNYIELAESIKNSLLGMCVKDEYEIKHILKLLNMSLGADISYDSETLYILNEKFRAYNIIKEVIEMVNGTTTPLNELSSHKNIGFIFVQIHPQDIYDIEYVNYYKNTNSYYEHEGFDNVRIKAINLDVRDARYNLDENIYAAQQMSIQNLYNILNNKSYVPFEEKHPTDVMINELKNRYDMSDYIKKSLNISISISHEMDSVALKNKPTLTPYKRPSPLYIHR